ncbi:MAG TPA: NAD(P)/FAD-dependent oxidoreductase [Streptosporangiaceae bacterium]
MTLETKGNQADSQLSAAPRVLVVGAGFSGLYAVRGLRESGYRVTIIDKNLYSTFQPLLYQVATGGLNPGDVSYAVGGYARQHHARYDRGQVTGIDTAARQVTLADGRQVGYDYLILATGVSASHFGIKGAGEYTYGLYTRADAVTLRDRFMADVQRLSEGPRETQLAVTMVGGGATGVELAGTIAELRDGVLRETFPDVDASRIHVRVVEMQSELLSPFDKKLRAYTRAQLVKRGVDVQLDTAIAEVTPDRVILKDGRDLHSDITVWTAGVAAPPEAQAWGLPQGRNGRIETGPDLRVKGQDRIFAVGDIGLVTDHPTPQLSQPAIQMGLHAARQIQRLESGQPTEAFHYHDKGQAATIGRRSAVIELAHGPDFTGTLAWLGWLGLHLFYLLGGRNRVSTLINLGWRYLTWGHGGTVIVGDEPAGGHEPAASRPGNLSPRSPSPAVKRAVKPKAAARKAAPSAEEPAPSAKQPVPSAEQPGPSVPVTHNDSP